MIIGRQDYWQVVKVKPGCEFQAQSDFQSMNVETFVPFTHEIRQWSDRKKKLKKCLIPRHVFVKIDPKDERVVYNSKYVLSYLNIHGQRARVWPFEIDRLKNYCQGLHHTANLIQGTPLRTPVLGVNSTVLKASRSYCHALSECGRFKYKI